MYVRSPGMVGVSPALASLFSGAFTRVGVVLEVYGGTDGFSLYSGTRCSVLLVESMHVLRDVVVGVMGGGASRLLAWAPKATEPSLMRIIDAAMASDGMIPSPSARDSRWGSWVVVQYLTGRLPYITPAEGLPHPAIKPGKLPVLVAGYSPMDRAAEVASADLVAPREELPDSISGQNAPPHRTPARYSGAPDVAEAYEESYRTAWAAGAEAAYADGETTDALAGFFVDYYAEARNAGWRDGWEEGQAAGLVALAEDPPDDTPMAIADRGPEEDVEEDGDFDNGDAVAAVTTADDLYLEHDGCRMLLRQDGMVFDSRGAGDMALQGRERVRATGGGATMDVGAEGGTAIHLAAGGPADQRIPRGNRLVEWMLTEMSVQTALGPSGPLAVAPPDDILSEKTKVT